MDINSSLVGYLDLDPGIIAFKISCGVQDMEYKLLLYEN